MGHHGRRGHGGYDRHGGYGRDDGYGRRRSGGLLRRILGRLLGRRRHH